MQLQVVTTSNTSTYPDARDVLFACASKKHELRQLPDKLTNRDVCWVLFQRPVLMQLLFPPRTVNRCAIKKRRVCYSLFTSTYSTLLKQRSHVQNTQNTNFG